VNHVLKGKLLESKIFVRHASSTPRSNSPIHPDFANALMNAIMDALTTHSTREQAGTRFRRCGGLKEILLGAWEALRRTAAKGSRGLFLKRKRFDAKFAIVRPHT
jgi:type I restriction enzyme R subunit